MTPKTGFVFPISHVANPITGQYCGMTLRDYFAAKAMAAMLTEGSYPLSDEPLATCAYAMADAMLKIRENPPK